MTPEAAELSAKIVLTKLKNRLKSNVESQKHDIKTSKLINHFNYYG